MTALTPGDGDPLERLRLEQRRRWQQGDRVPVEALLTAEAELRPDEDAVLDLLFREVDLREQRGERPTVGELVGRFPTLEDRVRRQFSLHEAFRSDVRPDVNRAATVVRPPSGAQRPDRGVRAARPVRERVRDPGELGRGGMGVVYKARQLSLNRVVALKMILSGAHAAPETVARFQAEAEAVARLQHPNLVQIYEIGDHEGLPYFAMEYLGGGSLADRLGEKPQAPQYAAELTLTLARAVQAIHERGLVHRDLKPGNVLMTHDGVPKIADFGLVKRLGEGGGTATGSVLGTPWYMAPEQAAGKTKEIGPLVDVYALGAMFYELLTGRPPFLAESAMEVVHRVVHEDPLPPTRLERRVPRDLETICLKCLEKEPAKRYVSAHALAEDLDAYLLGHPIKARPVGPLRRAWKWAKRRPALATFLGVGAAAAVALLAAGAAYNVSLQDALKKAHDRQEESRQLLVRLKVAGGARALDDGDCLGSLVWLTEALRLDEGRPGREAVHRLRLGAVLGRSPKLKQIWFHDGAVRHAAFSPDGRRVLTASLGGAHVWDAVSGARAAGPLAHDGAVIHAEFSAAADKVLTAGEDGTARLWAADTGKPLTPPMNHGAPLTCARLSPDGRLAVTAGGNASALLWDTATGRSRAVTFFHDKAIRWATFSPDGAHVATASEDGTARLWLVKTGAAVGPPWKHSGPVEHVEFSPDGKLALTCSLDKTARLWRVPSGEAAAPPLEHKAEVKQGAFSRDGKHVVTASDDRTAQLWKVATGERSAPALRHGSDVNRAAFSADGERVVTASDDNTVRVWDVKSGRPAPPWLPQHGTPEGAAFCPKGRLVLCYGSDTMARLWELPEPAPRAGADFPPPDRGATAPAAFSPDGKLVVRAESGNRARVRSRADDAPVGQPLAHGSEVLWVAFSPDGRLVATASDDNTAALWDAATGRGVVPPLRHRGRVHHVSFSKDGKLLATASGDETARVWDAATGEPVSPPLPHRQAVVRAAFGADGGALMTTGRDGEVLSWPLASEGRPVAELRRLAELLGASRMDATQGLLPLGPEALRERWQVGKQ